MTVVACTLAGLCPSFLPDLSRTDAPARLEAQVQESKDLTVQQVRELIATLGQEGYPEEAMMSLGKSYRTSLSLLIEALSSPDPRIRRRCADLLGKIGAADAGPALIKALGDDDEGVRATAAYGLGYFSYKGAEPGLVALFSDNSERVRRNAARAVGFLMETAEPFVLQALSDSDPMARATAVNALRNESRYENRITSLLTDPSPIVRAAALQSIGSTESAKKNEASVLEAITDASPVVRAAAANAIVAIESEVAARAVTSLMHDKEQSVRVAVLESLANRGYLTQHHPDSALIEGVRGALGDSDSNVRIAALGAVVPLGLVELLPDCMKLMNSSDRRLAVLAAGNAYALRPTGPESSAAVSVVTDALLSHPDEDVRVIAAKTLEKIDLNESIDALCRALLSDSAPYVRSTSAFALYRLESPRAQDSLIKALEDADGETLRGSAAALETLKDPRAFEPLLKATFKSDSYHRAWALNSLAWLDAERAAPRVIELLTDSSDFVRLIAVETLQRFPSTKAKRALQDVAANDWSKHVRDKAKAALRRQQDPVHEA